jgi:AmiR/NasT family two-component response regulator
MAAVVYLVQDLLFTSKIREAASGLGVEVASASDSGALADAARTARLVIVDLRLPTALGALDALGAAGAAAGRRVVGFVDHERTDVMDAARARGCEPLAKGQFASMLPALLRAAAGAGGR